MTADGRPAAGRDAPSPIALLIKVLEHEQKQGFRDQAVIGGLDSMLREQRERADRHQTIALNRLLAKLPREGYRSYTFMYTSSMHYVTVLFNSRHLEVS